jgi:hypothetical protein
VTVLIILLCLGLLPAQSVRHDENGDELASRLLASHNGASAISLAIIRGGMVTASGQAGVRGDVDICIPVRPL